MSKPTANFMERIVQLLLIALLVILMAAAVVLSGCTSGQQQDNAPPRFGERDGFANLTEEQRQQMFEQRMQEAKTACNGKSAGDACTIQSPRGNVAGACGLQNGTIVCAGGFGRGGPGTPPGNRTRPQN